MIWEELQSELQALQRAGLKRSRRTLELPCGPAAVVDGQPLISFCSNDYLGLANDPALVNAACAGARAWGVGSGASHLVSGHLAPHATLEEKLAGFTGFARALLFSTGYMANLGIVPALVGRNDAVFADRLNHASLIDAVQLSRADSQRYPHGDLAALERLLATSTARRKLILTDAVFSMDGDLAPLPGLLALAERFDAWLVVDDAHGFGLLGRQGRGSLAHFNLPAARRLVYMGTLGKAAGASGAFVAGDTTVIEWLEQRARTYIFTTASSPLLACVLAASLDLIAGGDARRSHLWQLVAQLRDGLANTRWRLLPSPTAIQPVIIGDNHEALRIASALYERGLWVPAIRPPTVPKGTARLRVSVTAAHTETHVARLVGALREAGMTSIVGQAPDLALIHGWGLGSAAWQPLLEPLSKSWRVHLIDLPGYCQSPSDGGDFPATAQTLIDTLPQGVTLCGWSLGAMLAMRAALLAPDRVAGLVLVGATASFAQRGDWCSAQPQELLDSFSASVERQPEQTLQRFVALLSQGDTKARPMTRTLLAGLRNGRTPDSAVLACGLAWLNEIDLRPRLHSMTTRSLLIHGENDVVTPVAAAQYLSETIPDARLEVFAGAGHAPFLSDPDRFVQLLDTFRHARTAT